MKDSICSGGFIVKNNKFLLGRRSGKKSWAPGLWDIVGGHSLKQEHPLLTLQRETMEEFGIQVINAELMKSIEVPDSVSSSFTYHIYMITRYKGKPANCSKEHSKIRWFKREELNDISLALPEYLEMIDDWVKNKYVPLHTIE